VRPANEFAPQQLVGKRVLFKDDEEHRSCWHQQVGLKTGVVLRLGQSLAQKAELIGSTELLPAELLPAEYDAVRLWVKADPCTAFPRGCEAAVEIDCLLVLGSETGSTRCLEL
jgi:hypothetical protein